MRRRWSFAVAGPVLALVACAGPSPSADGATLSPMRAAAGDPVAPTSAFTARVDRVVDGDTFIAVRRGARLRVRLIGVDTPETVRPDYPVECWGPEASALTHRLLPVGSTVRAAYQPGGRLDRYGRQLWDVWLPSGAFLQAVLVRRGAADAVAYLPQVQHAELLARLDAVATARGLGLHAACAG